MHQPGTAWLVRPALLLAALFAAACAVETEAGDDVIPVDDQPVAGHGSLVPLPTEGAPWQRWLYFSEYMDIKGPFLAGSDSDATVSLRAGEVVEFGYSGRRLGFPYRPEGPYYFAMEGHMHIAFNGGGFTAIPLGDGWMQFRIPPEAHDITVYFTGTTPAVAGDERMREGATFSVNNKGNFNFVKVLRSSAGGPLVLKSWDSNQPDPHQRAKNYRFQLER